MLLPLSGDRSRHGHSHQGRQSAIFAIAKTDVILTLPRRLENHRSAGWFAPSGTSTRDQSSFALHGVAIAAPHRAGARRSRIRCGSNSEVESAHRVGKLTQDVSELRCCSTRQRGKSIFDVAERPWPNLEGLSWRLQLNESAASGVGHGLGAADDVHLVEDGFYVRFDCALANE